MDNEVREKINRALEALDALPLVEGDPQPIVEPSELRRRARARLAEAADLLK